MRRGQYLIVIYLSAIPSAILLTLLRPSSLPINLFYLTVFLVLSIPLLGTISIQQAQSEKNRSQKLRHATRITRDARSWAFELKDDVIWYARIMKVNPSLFTPNQFRAYRKLPALVTNATDRLDYILNDLKDLQEDVSNIFAPFNEDFKETQREYQDTVEKLRQVNNQLIPIRRIVDSIEHLAAEDVLAGLDVDNDISSLLDVPLDSPEQNLSDEE